jgi:hypothetical protein
MKDYDYLATSGVILSILRKGKGRVRYLPRSVAIFHNDQIYDFLIAKDETSYEKLIRKIKKDGRSSTNLDELYTLKMSHRYLKNSPHFNKTMRQIHHLRQYGATVFSEDWLKQAEKETYDYGHPKLDQNKKEFFSDDGIQYIYYHDSIHSAMKLFDRPAYQYFGTPGEEVKSSKSRFFECSEAIRIAAVFEETTVLALERSQIPFPKSDPRRSWTVALEKVCTSITSGWFREYAWEHYDQVLGMYDPTYVQRFWDSVQTGDVKLS